MRMHAITFAALLALCIPACGVGPASAPATQLKPIQYSYTHGYASPNPPPDWSGKVMIEDGEVTVILDAFPNKKVATVGHLTADETQKLAAAFANWRTVKSANKSVVDGPYYCLNYGGHEVTDGGVDTSERFRKAQQLVKDIADRVTKDHADTQPAR